MPFSLAPEITLWNFGVHRDSISQSGSCIGSVSVHSLTLPHIFLHSWEYVMWLLDFFLAHTLAASLPWLPASSWPATLQPLCLGHKPKARVATSSMGQNISTKFISSQGIIKSTLRMKMYKKQQWGLGMAPTSSSWHSWPSWTLFSMKSWMCLLPSVLMIFCVFHYNGRTCKILRIWFK
jgi:hypothetical protein